MRIAMSPRQDSRRSMVGVSMIELMIAMTLGLIVLAALVSVFANSSAARAEMERSARQIENGRYAMEILTDDLRHAGFYGEATVRIGVQDSAAPGTVATPLTVNLPAAIPDPCSGNNADWFAALLIAVQGYDNGTGFGATTCTLTNQVAGTDVIVVRRAATCEAGSGTCAAATNGLPYVQISKCATETPLFPFTMGLRGTVAFTYTLKDCATPAGLRQYYVHIYYISSDNGATPPVAIPTLKRKEYCPGCTGADATGFVDTPLVEGIEQFNIEYGIDTDGDGQPDGYTADPNLWTGPASGCNPAGACTAIQNWANVVAVRMYVLARNIDPSPNYVDSKTYTLGHNAAGGLISVTTGDAYRRHVYSSLVRIVNSAERRDTP
jgi:type IV pilus assembly protein PilW